MRQFIFYKKRKKVIVMKQTPELNISLIDCLPKRPISLHNKKQLSCDVSSSAARNYLDEYEKDFDRLIMRHHDIVVWDPFRYFCGDDLCIFTLNGMPLYRDDLHVSKFGSQYLGHKMLEEN